MAYTGKSPVQSGLETLGEQLYRGFSEIGRGKVLAAQLGLEGQKAAFEMKKFQRYEQPILEAQRQDIQWLNQQARISDMFRGEGVNQFLHGIETIVPRLPSIGIQVDNQGGLVNAQGQPLSRRDLGKLVPAVDSLVASQKDLGKMWDDEVEEAQMALDIARTEGERLDAQNQLNEALEGQRIFRKDPIGAYQKQINRIREGAGWLQSETGLDTPWARESIARIQGSIDAHRATVAEIAKEKRTEEAQIAKEKRLPQTEIVTEEFPAGSGEFKQILRNTSDGSIIKVLGKPSPKEKADVQRKELDTVRQDFFNEIHQYNNAKRGVDQFMEDPHQEQVAAECYDRALHIAARYLDLGGREVSPGDLGLSKDMLAEVNKIRGKGPTEPQKESTEDIINLLEQKFPASKYKNQFVPDHVTGKMFHSDGYKWVEVTE